MKTVYSDDHKLHAPLKGFSMGKEIDCFEKPSRAQYVLEEVKKRNFGEIIAPGRFSTDFFQSVHDGGYISFLQTAHAEWEKEGLDGDAFASVFNVQHPEARRPTHIDGKLGYYMADTIVCITKTSWRAIESSAYSAITAQKLITNGDESSFALCRPPGHHASSRAAAGYCFINNAAVAAQSFIQDGARRVSILDVDYHHGNGTQEIFYNRNDVQFLSIHADPIVEYPYLLGYADETGKGAGVGYNFNYPLAHGTTWDRYAIALRRSVDEMIEYSPDAVIVSLGVDTFEKDPISQFKLTSHDYLKMGQEIARTGKPTLFVLEGGYAVSEVGINVSNTLQGYLDNQG